MKEITVRMMSSQVIVSS